MKVWAGWRAAWRRFWLLDEALSGQPVCATAEVEEIQPMLRIRGWVALRSGGGGKFHISERAEDDAIEYVTRRGSHSIVHIDRENGYIFYADKR